MSRLPGHLERALDQRSKSGLLRRLSQFAGIDLCSNDYLGFSTSGRLKERVAARVNDDPFVGATGSRLLSGNQPWMEEFEGRCSSFFRAESALLFNSGYDANLGLISALPSRHDTVLYDALVHASIRDGIRLGLAKSCSFDHNNVQDLRDKLSRARGDAFVVVESVYSMDGDVAPLLELCKVAEERGAFLIVDEAHATGLFGSKGEGLTVELGLHERVFARLHTFGKALGAHGAVVVGPAKLREYLINFARSCIYSTALDRHTGTVLDTALDLVETAAPERAALAATVDHFRKSVSESTQYQVLCNPSPIQAVLVPGNVEAKAAESHLRRNGFDLRAVLQPTVPGGTERLRVCLHSFNTEEQLTRFFRILEHHGCHNGSSLQE